MVHFYTTSTDKFLQARYIFERSGLGLKQFRSKRDPYGEDEQGTSEQLLVGALAEILRTLGQSSLFFVEDTSLSIDALGDDDQAVPGLHVKQWFADTSFEQLDIALRERGNNRRATVRSDIALHVPGLGRPVFVSGEARGVVADTPPTFAVNPQHPWLTPHTFNGWLIPDGARRRLGEMSLEESVHHDFRARALLALIDRLEEFAAVLNLAAHAYTRRARMPSGAQPALFTPDKPAFVIVGPTCAGKTTFALRAAERHDLHHIEASDVVRTFETQLDSEGAAEFAARVLAEHGADVVARRILELYAADLEEGFVISGFRTIQELLTFTEALPRTTIILVEAVDRLRFERYLARARTDDLSSLDEFRQLDGVQASFGLLGVAGQLPDIRITNEADLDTYLDVVDAVITKRPPTDIPGVSAQPRRDEILTRSQLRRCLALLEGAGRPLSTDEIEELSGKQGSRVRHNNANKVLKRYPALVRRLEGGSARLRYDRLDSGRAYLRYLDRASEQMQSDSAEGGTATSGSEMTVESAPADIGE
jgi:inosine/xanthosine triphosphate pyrophosphatase family protein/adenylate kinase family enzyme